MSPKIVGIGLVVLAFVGAAVMVLTTGGRGPRGPAAPPAGRTVVERIEMPTPEMAPTSVEVVPVVRRNLEKTIPLPGELLPFLSVDVLPRITGIVETVEVDRGSRVRKGELLIRLRAPELHAQRMEAEAKLQAAKITHHRLRIAAATPGIVAGNDLELAQHHQEAWQAQVESLREMEKYLRIEAPFDGVITERNVHPGAVVGPTREGGHVAPLLRLEQLAHLRLVVPVPEMHAGAIAEGATVSFSVPAYPQEIFTGTVSRISRSVDTKTRTMPCELDVINTDNRLAAGMFPEVAWPVRRLTPTLFVPATAVVTTTEKVFVLRVKEDTVEWVVVRKGSRSGDMMEIFGELQAGDLVVRRGTDELRSGTRVGSVVKS